MGTQNPNRCRGMATMLPVCTSPESGLAFVQACLTVFRDAHSGIPNPGRPVRDALVSLS